MTAINNEFERRGSTQRVTHIETSGTDCKGDALVFTLTCKTGPRDDVIRLWEECTAKAHEIWGNDLPECVTEGLASLKDAADRWYKAQREE